jgi:hypothetical protein
MATKTKHVHNNELFKSRTLVVRLSFGKTLWLTVIMLVLLLGTSEWVTRSQYFQQPLTPPKMGSRHYQLGHKLSLLDAAIKNNGPVDCIMVGSSMVDVGFNPDFFQKGYRDITQRDIHCFNFGIDATSAASTSALAKIVVEDYHPRLLLVGTDARDYVLPLDDPDVSVILETPWVRYRRGDFLLDGWLTEHSYFYRYRQHLSQLIRLNLNNTLWSETNLSYKIIQNGFTPINIVSTYINDPPAPDDTSFEVLYYKRIYSSYQVLKVNLAALEQMVNINGSNTQVVLVEMPVSDGLYYFFGNGQVDYNRFISQVSGVASKHQVPFWQTEPLNMIPDDGWSDYSHLNTNGAELFSTWLGQQVGKAEIQGAITVIRP